MLKKYHNLLLLGLFFISTSCGTYLNQPFVTQKARIGETTSSRSLLKGIVPKEKMVVSVYKFRDQTGQYKLVENGSTFSTSVTQGATSILLKSLEETNWFKPIERENIGNLLNERQIIRSTRQEYAQTTNTEQVVLPALLFAGMIFEGGIISYDSNIITGGSGARYFGVGASNQYREDRITVYLRAVSTSTGQILKNIYVSKTILSQGISANLFRYVNVRRLLEVETGVTRNEPVQLAVKEAIDLAVDNLVIEGIIDGLWKPDGDQKIIDKLREKYELEKQEANSTKLLDRKFEDRRGKSGLSFKGAGAYLQGDYPNSEINMSVSADYKVFLPNPNLNLNLGLGYLELENENIFKNKFVSTNIDLEYNFLPYEDLSPFVYAGIGAIGDSKFNNIYGKVQSGLGLEYLPINNLGIEFFGEYNLVLNDNLDGLVHGKRNDHFWRFGFGLNFYFGKPSENVKSVIFD